MLQYLEFLIASSGFADAKFTLLVSYSMKNVRKIKKKR